ncbi:MAG: hypothetical protein U0412_11940 [Nitrospira sp.]
MPSLKKTGCSAGNWDVTWGLCCTVWPPKNGTHWCRAGRVMVGRMTIAQLMPIVEALHRVIRQGRPDWSGSVIVTGRSLVRHPLYRDEVEIDPAQLHRIPSN